MIPHTGDEQPNAFKGKLQPRSYMPSEQRKRITPPTPTNAEAIIGYLQGRNWTSPTELGRVIWGKGHHSSSASPTCLRLVKKGKLSRNERGHYRLSDYRENEFLTNAGCNESTKDIPIGSRVILRRGGHDAPAPGQLRDVKATLLSVDDHQVECRLEQDDPDATVDYCNHKGDIGWWSPSIMRLDTENLTHTNGTT